MTNPNDLLDLKKKELVGIIFLFISVTLIGSLLTPWLSMKYKWSTTSNLTEGTVRFKSTGWGLAIFEGDLFVKSRNGAAGIDTTFFTSKILPIQLGIGLLIISFTALNFLIAMSFLYKPIGKSIPNSVKERINDQWDRFVLIEGLTLTAMVSLFTTFYFHIPINISSATPAHYPGSFTDLLDVYKGTYGFYSWTLNTLNISSLTRTRNLNPGLGIYLAYIGGLASIYLWFINFIREKKDWPLVWQRRAIFLPVLVSLAFMPIAIKYSSDTASTFPLIASPVLNNLGGIIYMFLIGVFTFLVYQTATEEKHVDSLTGRLYTEGDTLSEEEYNRITSKMQEHRETASMYRKVLIPLLIGVSILVALILGDLATIFMSFVGQTPKGNWLAHTPFDWLLLLTPLINIFLFLMFRR